MKNIEKKLVDQITAHSNLTSNDFSVKFHHDGDLEIKLPAFKLLDFLSGEKRKKIKNLYSFSNRPGSEALLRRIIYNLYKSGTLSADKSIIDIGAWISDNALAWSRLLNPEKACVYAIDPSEANIAFGKELAALNGFENISWHVAACSDMDGRKLYYEGPLTHTRFNEDGIGQLSPAVTTTLDSIVGQDKWDDIGLVHIDVEGLEKKVLTGTRNIIERALPVVIFEQHLGEEDPKDVFSLLADKGYTLYMINECLPDSALDCRNFMAVPPTLDISVLPRLDISKGREDGIWYAANGGPLIPFDL